MITIVKNSKADTRTCDYANVSREQLLEASRNHISDVRNALGLLRDRLALAAARHDADKLTQIDEFHADFVTGFRQTGWWDRHRRLNRHHLNYEDGIPEDVDLVDVLDYVADRVMSGLGRSGEVDGDLSLPPELLARALANTARLLEKNIRVVEVADDVKKER